MPNNLEFLNTKHAKYQENIQDVITAKACYLNKDFINTDTLPKFSREWAKDYDSRKKRALHINLFHELIQIPVKAIFSEKQTITRDYGKYKANLEIMTKNVNGNGLDLNNLMKELAIRALVGKQSYVYISSNPEAYDYPIIVPLWFDKLVNWYIKDNQYEWAMIEDTICDQLDPKGKAVETERILLYTKEYWEIYNKKEQKLIESNVNTAGVVPIIKFIITDADDDGMGEGWGNKLVPFDVEILNVLSLYQQEMYLLMFNVLTMPYNGQKKAESFVKTISEHNILTYDPANQPPSYLAPSTQTLQEKMNYIKWLIDMARYLAGFKGRDEIIQKAQSGIAKLFDYISTSETISSLAKALEQVEYQILFYLCIYNGDINIKQDGYRKSFEDFKDIVKIKYPTNFDIMNFDKELENLYAFIDDMNIMNDAAKLKAEEFISKILLMPYFSDDDKKAVMEYYNLKNLESRKKEKEAQQQEMEEKEEQLIPETITQPEQEIEIETNKKTGIANQVNKSLEALSTNKKK